MGLMFCYNSAPVCLLWSEFVDIDYLFSFKMKLNLKKYYEYRPYLVLELLDYSNYINSFSDLTIRQYN